MNTLKPGDLVYRVILTTFDENDYSLVHVAVKSASDRKIILERTFPFCEGVRFEPSALGRVFHATRDEAFKAFYREQARVSASAGRKMLEAQKARAWARQQCPAITEEENAADLAEINADRIAEEKANAQG